MEKHNSRAIVQTAKKAYSLCMWQKKSQEVLNAHLSRTAVSEIQKENSLKNIVRHSCSLFVLIDFCFLRRQRERKRMTFYPLVQLSLAHIVEV